MKLISREELNIELSDMSQTAPDFNVHADTKAKLKAGRLDDLGFNMEGFSETKKGREFITGTIEMNGSSQQIQLFENGEFSVKYSQFMQQPKTIAGKSAAIESAFKKLENI